MSIFNASSLLFFTFIPYTYSCLDAKLYNKIQNCKQKTFKIHQNIYFPVSRQPFRNISLHGTTRNAYKAALSYGKATIPAVSLYIKTDIAVR